MQSWGKLKSDLRLRIFPTGEAPPLIVPHDASFVDSIIDLQTWVPCLKQDNTNLIPQCATLFHCGLTVFDAPRGNIVKLSVIDKKKATTEELAAAEPVTTNFATTAIFNDPPSPKVVFTTTRSGPVSLTLNISTNVAGLQTPGPQFVLVTLSYTDANGGSRTSQPAGRFLWGSADVSFTATINSAAGSQITASITVSNAPYTDGDYTVQVVAADVGTSTSEDDWCSEIQYHQVDFCHIKRLLSKTATAGCCFDFTAFLALPTCGKNRFPEPTDAGLGSLPQLPMGFHYGQKSTDSKRRSRHGVWALDRGKIYIAPWIQSTETVIVKWDGIKRTWNDADLIDDDPLLLRAIENFVAWEHFSKWDKEPESAADAVQRYNDARSVLMYQCDEETRIRNCEASKARGSSFVTGSGTLFYNDTAKSFTAKCASGSTGLDVTVTIQTGTVASNVSISDANQKAFQQAQDQAEAQLNCSENPPLFTNDAQSFTAQCTAGAGAPTPTGNSVTRTIAAGSVTSNVSKSAANASALAQAEAQAEAALTCQWSNAQQTAVAVCTADGSKTQTVTIPAGTYTSNVSQDDANTQASNAAQSQANQQLVDSGCPSSTTSYLNTSQAGGFTVQCVQRVTIGGVITTRNVPFTVNVVVAPGTFISTTSQADANTQAINYATSLANLTAHLNCASGSPQVQTIHYP